MTDKEQIREYVKEFGGIIPAQMGGKTYKGKLWPSEVSKRCRELRQVGELESKPEGKFERFFFKRELSLREWRDKKSEDERQMKVKERIGNQTVLW